MLILKLLFLLVDWQRFRLMVHLRAGNYFVAVWKQYRERCIAECRQLRCDSVPFVFCVAFVCILLLFFKNNTNAWNIIYQQLLPYNFNYSLKQTCVHWSFWPTLTYYHRKTFTWWTYCITYSSFKLNEEYAPFCTLCFDQVFRKCSMNNVSVKMHHFVSSFLDLHTWEMLFKSL